ncbi:MAG: TetR/AcrR family transcriptional regulator [Gemmatimonadota bacterium]
MSPSATDTKERILDAAQELVMASGFSATSIDKIQEAADISRGTFFYHFDTKDDLARELVRRYAQEDREITDSLMARAESLARDPFQQVLIFVRLHEELFEEIEGEIPGCLFASYSYEAGLFDDETHEIITESVRYWHELVGGKLEEAFARREPVVPVDPGVLADLAYSVLQGAFILSRVKGGRPLMVEHIRQYRTYLELLGGVVEVDAAGYGHP